MEITKLFLFFYCVICWLTLVNSTSLNIKYFYSNQQIQIEFNQSVKYPVLLNKNPKLTYDENVNVFFKNDQELSFEVTKINQNDNEINQFPSKLLANVFPNLTAINFSNNLISYLNSLEDFSQMLSRTKVEHLDLSFNNLSQIDDENFRYLTNLKFLNLSYNQIKHISLFAFSVDSHKIIELDLSHNQITDSSLEFLLFSSLTNLKYLNMDYNRLTSLSNHFLFNLYNLEHLSLKYNNLKSFDLFYLMNKNNEMLKYIDLSFNVNLKFQIMEEAKSSDSKQDNAIESLNLAGIDLSSLNLNKFLDNLFENYVNLKSLNLSSTRIKSVLWSTKWPSTMRTIDLSNNLLKDSQFDCSQFNLSNKSFNFTKIDLSSNRFSNFSHMLDSCANTFGNTLIDMRENLFENLNGINSLNCVPRTSFLVSSNSLVCDCDENSWWTKINDDKSFSYAQSCFRIIDFNTLKCNSMSPSLIKNLTSFNIKSNNTNKLWKISTFNPISYDLISPNLFCPYKSICSSKKCNCCGHKTCDCASTCPTGCKCVRDFMEKFDIVDCTKTNLTIVPNSVPTSATELRLNQNGLKKIYPYQFFGRTRLQTLDLIENQIGFIEENGFNGLHNLKVLRLSFNNLQILLGYEFKDMNKLEELYLDNNKIQFISNQTFQSLRNLKFLNLLQNSLRHYLEVKVFFKFNTNLFNLSIDRSKLIESESQHNDLGELKIRRKFKKFDDFYFQNFIRYNLVSRGANLADPDSAIKCILNKFKHDIQNKIDHKKMKDFLLDNLGGYKILCDKSTKLLKLKTESKVSTSSSFGINTYIVGFLILAILTILFSSLLVILLNKYRKNSDVSCFKRVEKFLKFKFIVPFYRKKYEVTDLRMTRKRPNYDLFLVYNKIDSSLVTKLISPIFRSKPYNFKLILQHDKVKLNEECLAKYVTNSAFVLFVLSKNLLTDFEYDLAQKLSRSKKLAILADDVPESLAEKLVQPGRILRGTFNLENMSFNFKSINIYEDSVDSGFDNDRVMDFESFDESFVYRQGGSLNDNFDHNHPQTRKIEF